MEVISLSVQLDHPISPSRNPQSVQLNIWTAMLARMRDAKSTRPSTPTPPRLLGPEEGASSRKDRSFAEYVSLAYGVAIVIIIASTGL